jgi:polyhydroxybutyrate depolymerase
VQIGVDGIARTSGGGHGLGLGVALALVLALVLPTLAGCASGGPAPGAGPAVGPATTPATAPATARVGPAARPSAGCDAAARPPAGDAPPPTVLAGVPAEERPVAVDPPGRRVLLTRPAGEGSAPLPVVVVFHGHGAGAEAFAELTDLPAQGSQAGYLVVTAEGLARGADGKRGWQHRGDAEDAAYVDAVLDDLGRTECIDLSRVYLTGFSAGAAFTLAYACRHQDRVAAVATGAVEFRLGCTEPMSIVAFHGTDDVAVPYRDGAQGLSLPGVKVRGTELNMGDWAALGGCDPEPVVERIGTEVAHRTWTACTDGVEIELYTVEGGAHAWPGADPARAVGLTTQQISATDEALRFFGQHPGRPG